MVKLLECLNTLFGTVSLYEVLGIKKNASAHEIRKAYYKVSLQVHPDRVSEEEDKVIATKKFQAISQVYCILSSEEKRALYDESGEVDDESGILEENRDWDSYWRMLFKKVTIADIEKFKGEYRFSDAEKNDVITAYVQCEGNMDLMLEMIPCSIVEDDIRFKQIVDEKIKNGEVVQYEAFEKENSKSRNKRRKLAKAEEEEAKKLASEQVPSNDKSELQAMILKRQKDRQGEMDAFYDQLAAKYGKSSKTKKQAERRKRK